MLPVGPLMIEHRLIEKMIALIAREVGICEAGGELNPGFVDSAVDFIRTYADRCHHGKEEDILFRDLAKKPLSDEHRGIMDELVEEHRQGRKALAEIVRRLEAYRKGDRGAAPSLLDRLKFLADFYPRHIAKEDKRFFMPCMGYFAPWEKDAMLKEESEFDRRLVHEVYADRVKAAKEMLKAGYPA